MILDAGNKISYDGNGVAREFTYPFAINEETDIRLLLINPAGDEQVIERGFEVKGEQNLVIYPISADEKPLQKGYRLIIYRDVPFTQDVGLVEVYPFKTLEKMSDKSVILLQQLKDGLERALKISIAAGDDINIIFPAPKPLHSFRWDAKGEKLETTLDPASLMPEIEEMKKIILKETADIKDIARTAADRAEAAAEIASKYECGIEKKFFTTGNWVKSGTEYKLTIKAKETSICIGVDRSVAGNITRVLSGIDIVGNNVILETDVPYNGVAYFASFSRAKTNRYKKDFTITDWMQSGTYKTLQISATEHALGIDAICESIERLCSDNIHTNVHVQVDRLPNGSFALYTQEAFAGFLILTGGA